VCGGVCAVRASFFLDVRRQQLKHYDYTSPVMKINIALNQIPNFTCLPNQAPGVGAHPHQGPRLAMLSRCELGPLSVVTLSTADPAARSTAGPQHRCTIHLGAESMADIETAYQDALQVPFVAFIINY
jgi:hypothetical protein